MGRGKTSAAIQYMKENSDRKFMYVTPYLTEVDRICEACGFEQPSDETGTKLAGLKQMLRRGKSVSTTHALFSSLDEDALRFISESKYVLILDEAVSPIENLNLSGDDYYMLIGKFVKVDPITGIAEWIADDYTGIFERCKAAAADHSLFCIGKSFFRVMNPDVLRSFDDAIILTYLFDGQYLKAYLDYFGFGYMKCGIDNSDGYRFTSTPDSPPPIDYTSLINIIDDDRINSVGDKRTALSKTWFDTRGKNHPDIKKLRCGMRKVFERVNGPIPANRRLWTTFKDSQRKLLGEGGRNKNCFLHLNAKATNEYRECDTVLYLVNCFIDPNIMKFFASKGIAINEEKFALSEMIQFVWRSAIRDGNPITLYIPSRRMRTYLINWINSVGEGVT